MTDLLNELLSDACWVYIQQDGEDSYLIGITYNEHFREREISPERRILLWRKFDDTLSAAGYRIVLKQLSTERLKELITLNDKM